MAGYTRQSTASIQPGEDIDAAPLNNEFNQLENAFSGTTGHSHDGSTGNGPQINLTTSVTGTLPVANGGTGSTDGSASFTTLTATVDVVTSDINSGDTAGEVNIGGGATDNDGANIVLFGGNHATNPDQTWFRIDTTNNATVNGTGQWTFAQDATFDQAVSIGTDLTVTGTFTLSGDQIQISEGGTGSSTASGARTNLGLAIGTDVQAYDINLQSLSGLSGTADTLPYFSAIDTFSLTDLTPFARTLLDDPDATTARATLGISVYDESNVNITGGTINGTSVGATTPASGAFTTLSATGSFELTGDQVQITEGGTGATSASAARTNLGLAIAVEDKSTAYTAVAADSNKLLRFTAAATLSLTAAATLTQDWILYLKADGGDITIDPDGSETIDGAATDTIEDGQEAIIFSDGATAFYAVRGGGGGGGSAVSRTLDTLVSDGSQATMTLSVTPAGVEYMRVSYDGVLQEPTTDYTVSGTTLTFVGVPASGVRVVVVTDATETVGVPADGTITTAKIANGAVTAAKLAANATGGLFKGENGEVGNSAGDIFRINEAALNTDVTIDSDENASCTGPFEVATGVILTVNGVVRIL